MPWLQLWFDCDRTMMYRACLLSLASIWCNSTRAKMNVSVFCRSRIIVVSPSNRMHIVISITFIVVICVVVSSYRSRIVLESQLWYRLKATLVSWKSRNHSCRQHVMWVECSNVEMSLEIMLESVNRRVESLNRAWISQQNRWVFRSCLNQSTEEMSLQIVLESVNRRDECLDHAWISQQKRWVFRSCLNQSTEEMSV